MIINTKRPDQIPNCFLWWDFSDLSIMSSTTFSLSGGTNRNPVNRGSNIQDGEYLQWANDKIRGLTISSSAVFSLADLDWALRPRIRYNGINNLPSLSFGEDVFTLPITISGTRFTPINSGYTAGTTFSAYYRDGIVAQFPLNHVDNERTIFMVYQTRNDVNYPLPDAESITGNMNFDVGGVRNSTNTNLPPGKHGIIMSLTSLVSRWRESTSSVLSGTNSWGQHNGSNGISNINLLKYNSGLTSGSPIFDYKGDEWTVCNYVNFQNLRTTNIGNDATPNTIPSQTFSSVTDKLYDPVNKPSLFTFRVSESDNNIDGNFSMGLMENRNSSIIKNQNGWVGDTQLRAMDINHRSFFGYQLWSGHGGSISAITFSTSTFSSVGVSNIQLSLGNGSRLTYFSISSPIQTGERVVGNNSGEFFTFRGGFSGLIGEFIYYNRRLTDTETNQVKIYLKDKWGVE